MPTHCCCSLAAAHVSDLAISDVTAHGQNTASVLMQFVWSENVSSLSASSPHLRCEFLRLFLLPAVAVMRKTKSLTPETRMQISDFTIQGWPTNEGQQEQGEVCECSVRAADVLQRPVGQTHPQPCHFLVSPRTLSQFHYR